ARFADLIARYRAGEPAAYLVGRREFFGLDLLVTPAVLIPRPETELLVERALDLLNSERAAGRWPRVADVGTGSGAIAIALATSLPDLEVWAVDLSEAALAVARENARRHGVADRIRFLEGDLVAALPEPVDIILANLPYVPSPDGRIAAETAGWEPDLALDGGPDGLSVIGRLLHHAPDRLTRPGWILLEVGAGQAGGVRAIAERTLRPVAVETARDVHGHERLVVLRCPIS
ncbi:MAG TPA: peptide chain release factor N(5)-glutamine methyltransferase, partial [Dehalococcoidia bacterium]|nr:peptide chain release factor N(5)-glutamine methyltransferase [Dehalococcoidia bacterium]